MAAFSSLTDKLNNVFKKLKGKGKLTEIDVNESLREVRLALLEADVNFKVVKDFVNKIKERAIGHEVLESLTPAQQIIKIVNEELTSLMGGTGSKLTFVGNSPTVIILAGLQGAGKTTTAGKLAKHLKKEGKRPLLVSVDIYRPAAIEQLAIVAKNVDVPVFPTDAASQPTAICLAAKKHAVSFGNDVLIVDTAGRLHIDEALMDELLAIKTGLLPQEILLVVDAMTGQDAVNVAENFNKQLEITGVIMTKLDGDARGGATLAVKAVTGKPIKFVGIGEKAGDFEAFHPERMASRILGMGDMLSLIEKVQENYNQDQAGMLEDKLKKNKFTLEDFLEQMQQVKKMGSISDIIKMLPGANKLKDVQVDEKQLTYIEAIIRSMTRKERINPDVLNASRKKRIAAGSGTSVQQVNRLLKQFVETQKMMKMFNNKGFGKKGKNLKLPF